MYVHKCKIDFLTRPLPPRYPTKGGGRCQNVPHVSKIDAHAHDTNVHSGLLRRVDCMYLLLRRVNCCGGC
jgi:hypothetical protein